MNAMKSLRAPLGIAVAVALACATAPAWGIEAGDHIAAEIETPWNYKGAVGGQLTPGWSYQLTHPGATYIAIHFTDFNLAPGDYLIVSDPESGQIYSMEGEGKMNAGTFWAQHIKGDTVLLELWQVNPEGGQGFRIDEYVAGFLDIGGDLEAICGTDDKENAICYENSHPTEYERGRAVCRLLSNGSGFCTGWLVSADNHVMTNNHCVSSSSGALNTDFDFMAETPNCATPNCANCYMGTVFSGGLLIRTSSNLDYTLLQVANGDPASSFGYLEIDNRTAVIGEEIYIIGHPGARAKEFSIYSTHPNDPTGIPVVYSITQPPCIGSGYFDVGYFADTEGGSSGSPVLARSSHKVIALHHCANCPNRGIPINLIYPEIAQYLYPGPTGQVALDSGAYNCADVVSIEMQDGDLGASGSHNVVVTTTGGDSETVVLTETGANTAVFEGSIATDGSAVAVEDGTLQVADGDTIMVTYIDADDGHGGINVPVTDNAVADCVAPQIISVQTTNVEPRSAVVTIDANEPVQGTVLHGLSCGNFTGSATGAGYADPAVVNVGSLQDETTYYYMVVVEDEAGNQASDDNGGSCYSFTTPDVPDYFTEQFGSNDLDNLSLKFSPNGSVDFYEGCAETIAALPTDPTGGTIISLSDDSYSLRSLTGGATVSLYGQSYSSFYVGSNGYITFNTGDTTYSETLSIHFSQPRISGLFDDLNPSTGGTVSWKQLSDRAAVTWLNVPEYGTSNANTVQIEMFFNGDIVISYLNIDAVDGIAGLSEGDGLDPAFVNSDLSAMGPCLCLGDLDGDGDVDLGDLSILLSNYPTANGAQYSDGDLDGDGDVDLGDLSLLLSVYASGCP